MQEVRFIASSRRNIFHLENYNTLRHMVDVIPELICKDISTTVTGSSKVSVASGKVFKKFSGPLSGLNESDNVIAGILFLKIKMNGRKMIVMQADQPLTIYASRTHRKPSKILHDFMFDIKG